MSGADLALLIGYGLGAFLSGYAVGAFLVFVRKFFEQI